MGTGFLPIQQGFRETAPFVTESVRGRCWVVFGFIMTSAGVADM